MKSVAPSLLALLALLAGAPAARAGRSLRRAAWQSGDRAAAARAAIAAGDGTIATVVKELQKMLEDSKKEGEEESAIYAKFKCYCDDNTAEKKESVETLTKQIDLLQNKIQGFQGSNGLLSNQAAELKALMDDNEEQRKTATSIRAEEKTAFEKAETDMKIAIEQIGQAIDILSAIGADQSLEASAEHEQFMAGYKGASLLKLKKSIKEALIAANTFLTPEQLLKAEMFLQSPFTGTYSAHSGEIFGILKNMKETFESNLQSARGAEQAAIKAHDKFMETKTKEFDTMSESFKEKQTTLSSNDGSLAEKKVALEQAEQQKADDETFLEKLAPMCEKKAKEFEQRNLFRSNEQAAISEAISILDNGVAAKTFKKVAATSTGATGFLLQLSAVHRHARVSSKGATESAARLLALHLLEQAVDSQHSRRVARVVALLRAGNPFANVLAAIEKMKGLIAKEAEVDKEQLDWCKGEREENNKNLDAKTSQIDELNTAIAELEKSVDDPATGLKFMIQETQGNLEENSKSQTDETKARREENLAYQKDVYNTAKAVEMLEMAISTLQEYYKKLKEESEKDLSDFLQEDPAPPETWTGGYKGQSEQGQKVIKMIEFVLSETEKEEAAAHAAELEAQKSYEDSMAQLVEQEEDLEKSLAKTRKELADAEKNLVMKREELEKTEREKIAINQYLEQIKPGCDFVTDNFADREKYRGEEEAALDKAVTLLEGSPAFAAAKAADKEESFGKCKETCLKDEANVDCKACLAGTSIPGFCAGHPDTTGC